MIELFLNTTTREWFDRDGNPFGADMPEIVYGTVEQIAIWLKSETPDAGELGVDPLQWTKDVHYSEMPNLAAKITVDSDYIHKIKGQLTGDVTAGASVVDITLKTTLPMIPERGIIRLFSVDGSIESVRYAERVQTGTNTFEFTLEDGVSIAKSYTANMDVDCDQAPLCSAVYSPSDSAPNFGMWSFNLSVNSARLRAEMEYADKASVDVRGLELLLYTVDADGNEQPVQAFLLDTLSLVSTLGNVGNDAEVPDPAKNEVAALVSTLLSEGLDVEQQTGSNGATQIRVKLASSVAAGSQWSDWIDVGMSSEEIDALEARLEVKLKDHVQNELANQSW